MPNNLSDRGENRWYRQVERGLAGRGRQMAGMSSPAAKSLYAGYRFPAKVIRQTVWLYFRFPLSLPMVQEMSAARRIVVGHETVRQWALKFGQECASRIQQRLPHAGDKWHLDEVATKIAGVKHRLWRAVDQTGVVAWVSGVAGRAGRPCTCGPAAERRRGLAQDSLRLESHSTFSLARVILEPGEDIEGHERIGLAW